MPPPDSPGKTLLAEARFGSCL